ncbi:MAG: hypothetical protein ACT443_06765 [Gemmatimonadota bacterium]
MSEPQRSNLLPVVIGIALTCVLLAGLAYAAKKRRDAARQPAPQLAVLQPEFGAAVDSPLVVRFASTRPLELRASGWGSASYHLHAWIDGVEHMPAATDIVALDSLRYQWTLAPVARGPVRLFLAWADQAHRPLRRGASDTVTAIIR